jgi:hypothetical protein
MKKKFISTFVLVLSFMFCIIFYTQKSHAVIIQHDLLTNGDGLLTYDSSTGLEWLDLTQTKGKSYDWVNENLIGTGDPLEGFKYASPTMVSTLFEDASVQIGILNATSGNFGPVATLLDLVGVTCSITTHPTIDRTTIENMSWGLSFYKQVIDNSIIGLPPTIIYLYVPSLLLTHYSMVNDPLGPGPSYNGLAYIQDPDFPNVDENFSDPFMGHWLVREYTPTNGQVPEPTTMLLLGFGLIGLIKAREKLNSFHPEIQISGWKHLDSD